MQPTIFTRTFLVAGAANFLYFLAIYLLLPIIPLYVQHLGGGYQVVGSVASAFFIATILSRVVAGRLSDRSRAWPLLLGALGCLTITVLYPLARLPLLVAALRLLHGVAQAFFSTANTAIVADAVPPSRRGEALTLYGISANLATAIGPFAGLLVYQQAGFVPAFITGGAAALGATLFTLPVSRAAGALALPPKGGGGSLLGVLLVPFLVLAAFGFTYAIHVSFVPLLAQERSIAQAGLYYVVYAGAIISTRAWSGRLADRWGPGWIIAGGNLVTALAMLLATRVDTLPLLLLYAVVYGIAGGTVHPGTLAHMVSLVPPHRRGTATAAFYASFEIGIAVGGPAVGLMVAQWGWNPAFYVSAAIALAGALLHLLRRRR